MVNGGEEASLRPLFALLLHAHEISCLSRRCCVKSDRRLEKSNLAGLAGLSANGARSGGLRAFWTHQRSI